MQSRPFFGLVFIALVTVFAPRLWANSEPIRLQWEAGPETLDPSANNLSYMGFIIVSNTMETLVRNDENGAIVPALAKSYSVSADFREYRFVLREGAKWSDGKPVTVTDCSRGILRVYPADIETSGLEIVVKLPKPDFTFLAKLATPKLAPFREDFKADWTKDRPTNGRYIIKSFQPSEVVLAPNPYFSETGQRDIVFSVLPQDETVTLFDQGELDIITSFSSEDLDRYDKQNLITRFPTTIIAFFTFNLREPPFDDLRWRKAVAGVINRSELKELVGNKVRITDSYVVPEMRAEYNVPASRFESEVKEIRNLAEKPKLQMLYFDTVVGRQVVKSLQKSVKEELGVEMDLITTAQDPYAAGRYPLVYGGSALTLYDPLEYLALQSGGQDSGYQSEEYDQLLEDINNTPPGDKRDKLIREIQRVLVEKDVVIVPVFQSMRTRAVSRKISNYRVNPLLQIELHKLRKSD